MSGPVRPRPWFNACLTRWTAWFAVVSLSFVVGCDSSDTVPDVSLPATSSGLSQVRDNLGLADVRLAGSGSADENQKEWNHLKEVTKTE